MHTLDHRHVGMLIHKFKEEELFGRWITLDHIQRTFDKHLQNGVMINDIGRSEKNRPIYELSFGTGAVKVLIWTQMHGNESTGTKAVFDLLNYLQSNDLFAQMITKEITLKIIPILNPDGAQQYTRKNANEIDLNRDAVEIVAKESRVLRQLLDHFQPDFCFNMHDQRTIFGVSGTKNPATISFLAPSEEETRKVTANRKKAMHVIVAMNEILQQIIPNHIGRYTDQFFPNATGDHFQKLGFPTILVESGHYAEDYDREITRSYTLVGLLSGLNYIALKHQNDYNAYFEIPNNQENFRDVLHKYYDKEDEAFQYKEVLENGRIKFVPIPVKEKIFQLYFHKEIVFVS